MGFIETLKKFKNNFTGNIKYIAGKLSYGMKKAEERRSKIASDQEFQNFSKGVQNLNKNLLGETESVLTKHNTPEKFNDALGTNVTLKQFDTDTPTIKIPKSGLEKNIYPKKKRYIIEDDDFTEDEPEIIYIKRKKRKPIKRPSKTIYIEEDDDIDIPKGFTNSFETLSGVSDNNDKYDLFEETDEKPKQRKKQTYDFLHGSR